jgi:hypothetical protein
MTWQNFSYSFLHAARDAGASAITSDGTFASAGGVAQASKYFLIDDRAGSLATYEAAANPPPYVQIDRGAAGEELTRLIIPEGHNLNGKTVRVLTSNTGAFAGEQIVVLGTTSVTSTGIIDEEIALGTAAQRQYQYVRVDHATSGSWNPEIPELILTNQRTPSIGPERNWTDYLRHNTLDFPKQSGAVASLSLGADRRFVELLYRHVDDSDDLDIFSELIATCGTSKPFWLDLAFTGDDPVWMKLTEDSVQRLDRAAPGSPDSARPEIPLSMLEHLA